jgi:hypothetical protein
MKSAGVSIKFLCAAALVFGVTVAPRPTRAAQVVFTFNCIIVNATTCNPTSPLGSLTLADNVADSRRVDLDLTINTQQGIGGLKYFYLNYDQSLPAGPVFGLVAQDAAPDVSEPVSLVSQASNNTGPAGTRLDLRLYPEASGVFAYSASLARARFFSAPYNHSDLNLDMFNLKDANGLLYAALETVSGVYAGSMDIAPDLPTLPEGSSAAVPVVQEVGELPEPGTLALLSVAALGALGMARTLRRRALR